MRIKAHTRMICSVPVLVLGLGGTLDVCATQSGKSTPIQEAHFYSKVRVDNPDIVWLKLPGPWAGTTCAADWGWFNSKDDPALVAAVLVARSTSATVVVYVDDAYPKIQNYCQITMIASV